MSARLQSRVRNDFPAPGSAEEVIRVVASASSSERVQAAIVLWGRGDIVRLKDSVALAALDWRDVLMRADLGDDDWEFRLDRELGPTAAS
jgi:hypothetical protein